MDKKRRLVLIAAVVLGLLAVFLVNVYLQGPPPQQKKQATSSQKQPSVTTAKPVQERENTTRILVAKSNIPRGAALEKNMFAEKDIPFQYAQPKVATSFDELEGKIALLPILKGEQVLVNKAGSDEEEASLTFSMKVPSGKRAVTIMISRMAAAGGRVKAGDYIDIFCNFPFTQDVGGKPVQQMVTIPLLQQVSVLGVEGVKETGTQSKTQTAKDLAITLALNLQEVGLLLFVKDQGAVNFVLRSPLDSEKYNMPPIGMETFIRLVTGGGQAGPAAQAQAGPGGAIGVGAPETQQPQGAPAAEVAKPQLGIEVYKGLKKE